MKKIKVSSLFHVCFGFLMFMPIIAVCSTILVNTFSKEEQKETVINYKYETNEVNTLEDLVEGNIYHLNIESLADLFDFLDESDTYSNFTFNVIDGEYRLPSNISDTSYDEYYSNNTIDEFLPAINLNKNIDNITITFFAFNINENYISTYFDTNLDVEFYYDLYIDFDIEFLSYYGLTGYRLTDFISKCENIPIESVDVQTKDIDNTFYKSIDQIKNSNVFNWSMDSFLVQPFSYICGLFGMPSDNIVILLLSYWLSISIIWLVFDIVVYIPNLAHSWIDKGGIE